MRATLFLLWNQKVADSGTFLFAGMARSYNRWWSRLARRLMPSAMESSL